MIREDSGHNCKQHFAGHGVPAVVHTDGGPQFTSKHSQWHESLFTLSLLLIIANQMERLNLQLKL